MLPDDWNVFLRVLQERDPIVVIARDSDSAEIQTAPEADIISDKTLCLWNRRLLPALERKWIPQPGYYRVDTLNTPVLESTPSFTATWQGKRALCQGRLFGNFEPHLRKPKDFEKWYESLVRWIRNNYRKDPTSIGGYVAPAAYQFCESGGYLLPNFLPPNTKEWLAKIEKQHTHSRRVPRAPKTRKARSE